MIRGVANVWMPVQDIERAVDFYQNILGFRLVNRDGPWAEVDANGVRVGLNGREPNGAGTAGGPVLTFQLEAVSLEEAAEDLKSNGVEFPAGISEHDWGRVVTLKIPTAMTSSSTSPPRAKRPTTPSARATKLKLDRGVREARYGQRTKGTRASINGRTNPNEPFFHARSPKLCAQLRE